MAAFVDQPAPRFQLLELPVELPGKNTMDGPLKLKALAEPKPEEGAGFALAPKATLSKFQEVRVLAAFTPHNEAKSTDVRQTRFFIFI
jgi:hypothetical protein